LRPVLFAGLLDAWGHKGPAEIPAKRRFTYRQVVWVAKRDGIPLRFPRAHPFNPLRPMRLALALGCARETVGVIFRFIWEEGRLVEDDAEWAELARRLGIADADARISSPEVKAALRRNGEDAVAAGVFGVPSFVANGEVFWGYDGGAMFLDYLRDPAAFLSGEQARVAHLPAASVRRGA
ncbi:MAG TPA: DsbA family protein, partial [Burkholderiales bacterium]|nr:DsbA family protein [Burkholderiales bacterium]